MPGLDGVRASALVAVLAYHLGAPWPKEGPSESTFPVLSGYLIASLLLTERRNTGRIDLVRFWIHRARRLLPALFAMMAVVLAVMVLLHPGEVAHLRGATLASLAYVANWYFTLAEQASFDQFGRPSIFRHLWSLAVEEQFYLLWPAIMAAGIAVLGRRRLLVGVLAGIAGATVLAWVLFQSATDAARIYFGTDTRAVGLLTGVALAFLWAPGRLRPLVGRLPCVALDAATLGALAVLTIAMTRLSVVDADVYQGGFLGSRSPRLCSSPSPPTPPPGPARRSGWRRSSGSANAATGCASGTGRSSCSRAQG